jgi:hypothetical protein
MEVQRSQWVAMLVLVATFATGAVVGFAGDRMTRQRAKPPCPRVVQGYVDRIAKEWDLTAAQRRTIDSLMDEHRRKVNGLYKPAIHQLDSLSKRAGTINDSTLQRVRAVLTPAQLVKLDAMRESEHQRAEQMRIVCKE